MIALALLPLGVYFFVLARFFARSTPTVLNGAQDFALLAWGLFGLITLGPGRLIIPIDVLVTWGKVAWLFWTAFYFLVVQFVSKHFRCSIVVYHCSLSEVISSLLTFGEANKLTFRFQGNVLDLPEYQIQCTVNDPPKGGHVIFKPTSRGQSYEAWQQFAQDLDFICCGIKSLNRHTPLLLVFHMLALGFFGTSAIILFWQLPHIVALYVDYWG